jgi:hypothetical protein
MCGSSIVRNRIGLLGIIPNWFCKIVQIIKYHAFSWIHYVKFVVNHASLSFLISTLVVKFQFTFLCAWNLILGMNMIF